MTNPNTTPDTKVFHINVRDDAEAEMLATKLHPAVAADGGTVGISHAFGIGDAALVLRLPVGKTPDDYLLAPEFVEEEVVSAPTSAPTETE